LAQSAHGLDRSRATCSVADRDGDGTEIRESGLIATIERHAMRFFFAAAIALSIIPAGTGLRLCARPSVPDAGIIAEQFEFADRPRAIRRREITGAGFVRRLRPAAIDAPAAALRRRQTPIAV
jgi:hypothetical protein